MPFTGRRQARTSAMAACAAVTLLALGAGGAARAADRAPAALPPTEASYRKLCRAIHADHIRALFAGPVAPIELGGSSDCAFLPRSGALDARVRVFLRIDDGDQTLWKHRGDHPYGKFRTLALAGAKAKWGYEGGRLPSVVDARKNTFTCTVIPAAGGTGFVGLPGSALTAARSFAQRAARLCADVFAADR